jgi:hypothetical protein
MAAVAASLTATTTITQHPHRYGRSSCFLHLLGFPVTSPYYPPFQAAPAAAEAAVIHRAAYVFTVPYLSMCFLFRSEASTC